MILLNSYSVITTSNSYLHLMLSMYTSTTSLIWIKRRTTPWETLHVLCSMYIMMSMLSFIFDSICLFDGWLCLYSITTVNLYSFENKYIWDLSPVIVISLFFVYKFFDFLLWCVSYIIGDISFNSAWMICIYWYAVVDVHTCHLWLFVDDSCTWLSSAVCMRARLLWTPLYSLYYHLQPLTRFNCFLVNILWVYHSILYVVMSKCMGIMPIS